MNDNKKLTAEFSLLNPQQKCPPVERTPKAKESNIDYVSPQLRRHI
ncbi:MAG TPA: hypothetical protein VIG74_00235 [Alphaproteobacteria bacterium]|jgi:hypothetical protein